MGGGGTQTSSQAEYPPEFRPLATAAVAQLKEMMGINPLNQYAVPNPGLTAGLSPYQVSTMQTVPQLNDVAAPIQGLMRLGTPVSQLAQQAGRHGDRTEAARGALFNLSKYAPGFDFAAGGSQAPAFGISDLPWGQVQGQAFSNLPGFPNPVSTDHYATWSMSPEGQLINTPANQQAPFQAPQSWRGQGFGG